MSTAPTSYEALAVSYGLTMLAGSATFQALVGAANAAAALAWIINTYGGNPGQTNGLGLAIAADGTSKINCETASYAEVGTDGVTSEIAGVGVWDRRGTIFIRLVIARRVGSESPADAMTRAWNAAGAIRADIEAQFGSAGCLAVGRVDSSGLDFADEDGADQNHAIAGLAISYEG